MMKEKYNLMKGQYEDLKSSLSSEIICENHRKEIYQLRKQIVQYQTLQKNKETAATIDQESVQIRILKGQYEREKRLVEDKVRELAMVSVTGEEDLERQTKKLKNELNEVAT